MPEYREIYKDLFILKMAVGTRSTAENLIFVVMPDQLKYRYPILFFISFLLLFSQCREAAKEVSALPCEFATTAEMQVPVNTSITYKIHDMLEDDNIFVAYHYPSHSVDLLDLKTNTFIKKLSLEREGPNAVSQVLSLYVHNLDSIFLLTLNQVIGINADGQRFFAIKINRNDTDLIGFDMERFRIWCNPEHNQPIYYSEKYNSLYVALKPYETRVSMDNYSLPLAGRISLESLEFEYLPIRYPDKFQTGYFGVLDNPHLLFFDDFSVAAFGAGYDLYRFDNTEFSVQAYGLTSDYIKDHAEAVATDDPEAAFRDFEKMQAYFNNNPRTSKLRANRQSMRLYNLYYAPYDPNRLHYRTISFFEIASDGSSCRKMDERVVEHEAYMTKMFFPVTDKGLGLIDKTSTDDHLKLKFIACGS